jgi:hypothetical protein
LLRLDATLAYSSSNTVLTQRLPFAAIEATRACELSALRSVASLLKAEINVVAELNTALLGAIDAMKSDRGPIDIEDGGEEGVQRAALATLAALRSYIAGAGRRRCRRRAAAPPLPAAATAAATASLDKLEIAAIAKVKVMKLVLMLAKLGAGKDDTVLKVSAEVGRSATDLLQLLSAARAILTAPSKQWSAEARTLAELYEARLWEVGTIKRGRSPTLDDLGSRGDARWPQRTAAAASG